MTLEEIKANAPDGATHYTKTRYGIIYTKMIRGFLYGWDGSWYRVYGNLDLKPLQRGLCGANVKSTVREQGHDCE